MRTFEATVARGIRATRWLVGALLVSAVLASPALAAKKSKESEAAGPPKKSYVTSYIIVIFVVGLGLMAAVRPSTRADKPKEKIIDDE